MLVLKSLLYNEQKFNRLLRTNDARAFENLFNAYGPSINGIIGRIFPDPLISDLVFRNLFLHIWKNIHNHDPTKNSLFSWMIFITRTYVRNIFRGISQPGKSITSSKNILDLSYGYTKEEISELLNVHVNIVNTLVLSAISKIRENNF